MKPTKNRFFCNDCGRRKMRFETKKKADTFIKFNGDEIEAETGYKPERSYNCIACNSWHVTSAKEFRNIRSKTEIFLEKYQLHKEETKKLKSKTMKNQPELKEVDNQIKVNILKETRNKREDLNIQLVYIEGCIKSLKTLMKFEKIDERFEILNDAYTTIEVFKTTISELRKIYENIMSDAEIDQMFLNKQKRKQQLDDTLNLLEKELKK